MSKGGGSLIKGGKFSVAAQDDNAMRTPGLSRLYSMGGYEISLMKQHDNVFNFGTF